MTTLAFSGVGGLGLITDGKRGTKVFYVLVVGFQLLSARPMQVKVSDDHFWIWEKSAGRLDLRRDIEQGLYKT